MYIYIYYIIYNNIIRKPLWPVGMFESSPLGFTSVALAVRRRTCSLAAAPAPRPPRVRRVFGVVVPCPSPTPPLSTVTCKHRIKRQSLKYARLILLGICSSMCSPVMFVYAILRAFNSLIRGLNEKPSPCVMFHVSG